MSDRFAATLLAPAGYLYGMVMRARNALYDSGLFRSRRSPIPVVSVGNITTGGTGKTPLVDWIIGFYREQGLKTAILSRGYGRSTKGARIVSDGASLLLGSREAGDEVAMLASKHRSTVVVVAERRIEGIELIMKEFAGRLPDVIVLDDGFQHRALARELDIVVINASEPLFDARMLPAGHLREPLEGLERADLFVLNKITDPAKAEAIAERLGREGKPVVMTKLLPGRPEPAGTVEKGAGRDPHAGLRAFAFAGIGAPGAFLRSLEEAGVEVVASKFFRDHQPYTPVAVREIVEESKRHGAVPVTTEKDWHRIAGEHELAGMLTEARCHYLPVTLELSSGQELLRSRLLVAVRSAASPAAGKITL